MNPGLEELLPRLETYTPNTGTLEQLHNLNTIRITGPPRIGKTTCAHEVVKGDDTFVLVEGFSTDPTTTGRLIEARADFKWLEAQLEAGTVAHIVHHPITNEITGSTIDEYPNVPSQDISSRDVLFPVIDMPYQAVDTLPSKQKPYMLVGKTDDWTDRLVQNTPVEDLPALLEDARGCLEWSLCPKPWNLNWLFNALDTPEQTASEIRGIAQGIRIHSSYNSHFAGVMLNGVREKLGTTLETGSDAPGQTKSAH